MIKNKINKFELLQDLSIVNKYKDNDIIEVTVKGWENPEEWFEQFIILELQDYYENYNFRLIKKEEIGYSCSRFFEGICAEDEGFNYYINFQKYKKGLGKVTIYTIMLIKM